VSIPRYTFWALLKLEYSWRDTYEVHPMFGAGGAGFPSRYIFAENTGFFQLMRNRKMDAVAGAATFSADTTLTGAAATLVSALILSSNNAVDISSAAQAIVKTVGFVSTSHATKQRNLPDTSVLSGVQQK
jgi:hypothetical protein